ncbi:MAG TPA: hypothetical protein VEG44_10490 [Candidatus Acidoferrales bacterium]|nr:hypothetical protein [Candidatus Acidoferrales bacterium]
MNNIVNVTGSSFRRTSGPSFDCSSIHCAAGPLVPQQFTGGDEMLSMGLVIPQSYSRAASDRLSASTSIELMLSILTSDKKNCILLPIVATYISTEFKRLYTAVIYSDGFLKCLLCVYLSVRVSFSFLFKIIYFFLLG